MKGKQKVALLLSLLMFWLVIPFGSVSVNAAEAKEEATRIVHYATQDDKDWNLWVCPENGDGAVYEFTGEDAFGKVARITIPGVHRKVGFIVRTDTWEMPISYLTLPSLTILSEML